MPRRKKNQSADNPAVDAVSQNLGMTGDNPQQAAADEAAKAAAADEEALDRAAQEGAQARAQADGLDLTDAQETPPQVGEEETQPDEPAEPEDEQPMAPVVELSPRMVQQLTPQETPLPRQSKKQKAEEAQAARIAIKTQSPSTKRLGPLSSKVPGAEHVKIHKRAEDGMPGKRAYVGDYDVYDLSQSQDLETFIARYIKPKWGAGEYQITGVDAKGQEFDAGVVKLIDPIPEIVPVAQQGVTAMDLLQTLLLKDQQRRDREIEALRSRPHAAPPPPPPNPVQQLGEVFDLHERVGQSSKKETEGTLAAMIQAMSEQNRTMMTLLLSQQSKGDERMAAVLESLGRPKEMDPVLGVILTKLMEDVKGGGNMPPPPPPPPQRNPTEDLKTLAEVMALLKGSEDKDRLSIKEILELVKGNTVAAGTDDFKKAMENLTLMMQAAQTLKQATEGSAGSGFWEFASALVSNRDLAGSIGDAVRSRMAPVSPAAQHQQHYRVLPQNAVSAEEEAIARQIQSIKERRLLLARRKLQAERQGLEQDLINDTARHRPVVMEDSPEVPQPALPVDPPPVADQEDMQAVERTRARMGGKLPQFPPDIAEYINAMVLADDDGTMVESIIRMLTYLSELEDWKQFADLQMRYVQAGEKESFLMFMGAFFDGLIKIKYMGEELKGAALGALDQHFDVISEKAQEEAEEEEGEEEGEEGDENLEEP